MLEKRVKRLSDENKQLKTRLGDEIFPSADFLSFGSVDSKTLALAVKSSTDGYISKIISNSCGDSSATVIIKKDSCMFMFDLLFTTF